MEETREKKDIVEKEFVSFPDVTADVINALLYQGKRVTEADNLLAGPTETIYQGFERLRSQYEDLCKYELADGKISIMYLIANQSRADGKMLLRKAGYTGGIYREQYEKRMPAWMYIDGLKLHVFEMRHLSEETRKLFQSDMRIVVDFLAEGDGYRSSRKIIHKAALIKMIKVLSGETDVDFVEKWMKNQGIREEDELTVCELFDQYVRQGRTEGMKEGLERGEARRLVADIESAMKFFQVTLERACEGLGITVGRYEEAKKYI